MKTITPKKLKMIIILFLCVLSINCGNELSQNNIPALTAPQGENILLGDSAVYAAAYDTILQQLGYTGFYDPILDTTTFEGNFYNATNLVYSESLRNYVLYSPLTYGMQKREQALANLFTDALLYYSKTALDNRTQIFFMNASARLDNIRSRFSSWQPIENNFTVGAYDISGASRLYEYIPTGFLLNSDMQMTIDRWNSKIAVMRLSGKMLKDIFERGVDMLNNGQGFSGNFAHFSGAVIEVDTAAEGGIGKNRIKKILLKNTTDSQIWTYYESSVNWDTLYDSSRGGWQSPYTENNIFFISVNTYIAEGADGYTPLLAAKFTYGISAEALYPAHQLMDEYFKFYKKTTGRQTITPIINQRIKYTAR